MLENHRQEWLDSHVNPELIDLNVTSLSGDEAYENLLYGLPGSARRNDGRLRDQWLNRYDHLGDGGWWVSGLDPLNNWEPMDWGRFKPDLPRFDEKKDKPIKYESPPKVPNRVTYFDVPDSIGDLVAKRYHIKRYNSPLARRLQDRISPVCFWEWVKQHPEIPIILTEGEKKAAALLSLGYVAIALPGIWNGRVGKQNLNETLHPDLVPMAQPGRQFQILFDYETKDTTRKSVSQAIIRTGKTIEAEGCTCVVPQLPGPEKGVDDFIAARGERADVLLTAILNDAISLKDYQNQYRWWRRHGLSPKYQPQVIINAPYIAYGGESTAINPPKPKGNKKKKKRRKGQKQPAQPFIPPVINPVAYLSQNWREGDGETGRRGDSDTAAIMLPESGLVALWSDMATGKTEFMRQWREQHPDARFLNNGHRVNLLKNLSQRLDTQMYSDIHNGRYAEAQALSITIDSLHKLYNQLTAYDCLFIDEACQYLAHLLHSKTCQEHRAEILEVLQYLVRNAKLVVLADAHLDDITLDFFRAMRPKGEIPYIIKNDYKNGGRTIFWYEGQDSSVLVRQIFTELLQGKKLMVVSDSKRFIKKLEALMKVELVEESSGFRVQGSGFSSASEGAAQGSGAGTEANSLSPSVSQDAMTNGSNDPAPPEAIPSPTLPKTSQKYSKNNSELRTLNSELRIWSIHSENSGSEENVALIKDISSEVKNIDVLLASPSLGTGVDIPHYHFDAVFGAFHAVSQTATECAQHLHRYRPIVPFHVWVNPRPPFGYKQTNASQIKERMLQSNAMTAFLIRIDPITGKTGAEKEWALDAYCEIEAARNQSLNNLREDLRFLLEEMGNEIIPVGHDKDDDTAEKLKQAGKILDAEHRQAVVNAEEITKNQYLSRQSQDYLNPDERVEVEKYRIAQAYGMPVTEELVDKDKGGLLISQIIALEGILAPSEGTITNEDTGKIYPIPPALVTERDLHERDQFPFCFDWNNHSSTWIARNILGLDGILQRLIAGEEIRRDDPYLIEMTEKAVASRAHIKALLNLTVPVECTPIWLLSQLLEQLSLKLTSRKDGGRGEQELIYRLQDESWELAQAVLAYRQRVRTEKAMRRQQQREKQAQHQAFMQTVYGFAPSQTSVSNPLPNSDILPTEGGSDTAESQKSEVRNQKSGGVIEPELDINQVLEEEQLAVSSPYSSFDKDSTPNSAAEGTRSARRTLNSLVAMLMEAMAQGVAAVQSLFKSWTNEQRWQVLARLEDISEIQLQELVNLAPDIFLWADG